jgi:hypothetical protein
MAQKEWIYGGRLDGERCRLRRWPAELEVWRDAAWVTEHPAEIARVTYRLSANPFDPTTTQRKLAG